MKEELREKLIALGNTGNPFHRHNGIRVTHVGEGEATVEVDLRQENLNSWGAPHGGLLFTMADVACGLSAISLRQEACVTVNAGVDFIAATEGRGVICARAQVLRCGGKLCFSVAEVRDEQNTLLARVNITMYFTGRKLEI